MVVAALLVALSSSSGASAHARYVSSTPADGETVAESPAQVEAVFAEEMGRSGGLPTMVVVSDSGDVIAEEAILNDDDRTRMTIELPPSLPEGRYTVIWHNVSDSDGDEAQGAFTFNVGASASQTPAAASPTGGAATPAPTTIINNGGTEDDGSGIPLWALAAGIATGIFMGGALGVSYAARRES